MHKREKCICASVLSINCLKNSLVPQICCVFPNECRRKESASYCAHGKLKKKKNIKVKFQPHRARESCIVPRRSHQSIQRGAWVDNIFHCYICVNTCNYLFELQCAVKFQYNSATESACFRAHLKGFFCS